MRTTTARHSIHPPRARLAFRVGVVGHRPDKLPGDVAGITAIQETIAIALRTVRDTITTFHQARQTRGLYTDEAPILRAISPLAEGTDRIFAHEALKLHYELCCVMPFQQLEFENDFMPPKAHEEDSVQRFRDFLQLARSGAGLVTFELDGKRDHENEAYGAAGKVVLNQSDLLIVVWNGHPELRAGGTLETLKEALHYRVPVIWIDTKAPYGWRIMHDEAELACLNGHDPCVAAHSPAAGKKEREDQIAEAVRSLVIREIDLPHHADGSKPPRRVAADYFAETRPTYNRFFLWKLFRDLVGSCRLTYPTLRVPDFELAVADEWPTETDFKDNSGQVAPPPGGVTGLSINAYLRPHYSWADKLADFYADRYRSAYVGAYFLAAIAVLTALFPVAFGWGETFFGKVFVWIELFIMVNVIMLLVRLRWRRWHQRWMDYRLLAEMIRQVRFLVPVGGGRPFPHIPPHLAVYGDPTQTWMHWHTRGVARATGLPNAKVTPHYVRDCLDYLAAVIGDEETGQLCFHLTNRERSHRISHRLHGVTVGLLSLTVIGIVLHLLQIHLWGSSKGDGGDLISGSLMLMSAFLPALSAALAGIDNQGEFLRISKRAAAMADSFKRFGEQIEALRVPPTSSFGPKLAQLAPLASNIAAIMVDEVMDWRVVFIDRATTSL